MAPSRKDLYESLEIKRDATSEEIRRAYRRKALDTHPDRLPQGATEDEIKDAAERFRNINNAYEVLSNEANRKLYDQCGVWPPPNVESQQPDPFDYFDAFGYRARHRNASRPYASYSSPFDEDPFFTGFNRRHDQFRFTDPFELFDQFRQMGAFHPSSHEAFESHGHPFSHHDHHSHHNPAAPHSSMFGPSLFDAFFGPSAVGQSSFGFSPFGPSTSIMSFGNGNHSGPFGGNTSNFSSFSSSSTYSVRGGGSTRNSHGQKMEIRSQTINGVTHTVKRKVDADGNEHEERIYPDGRKEYFYNGVAQGSDPAKLEGSSKRRRRTQDVPQIEAPAQEHWQSNPESRTSERRKHWWRGW